MRGGAPLRYFQTVILFEIPVPLDFAVFRVQANQMTLCAGRVNPIAIHRGRNSRTDGVCRDSRVITIPLVDPFNAAVLFLQTDNTLRAGQKFADEVDVSGRRTVVKKLRLLRVNRLGPAIHHVDLSIGHRRPGVTSTQRRLPT